MLIKTNNFIQIIIKCLVEFGPILVFVLSFEKRNFFFATGLLIFLTILSTIYAFFKEKRIPYFALFIAFMTVTFGWLTLEMHDPRFLQIRDTVYDGTLVR